MVITASTKVKEMLEKYPELREELIKISPKFQKLNNKFIYNTVARWATVGDIARIGKISICELLHTLNSKIGMEKELMKIAPDCIKEEELKISKEKPDWLEDAREIIVEDVREREDFFFVEIMQRVKSLHRGEVLKIVNSFFPAPLVNLLKEEGYQIYIEEKGPEEYEVYVKWKKKDFENWLDRKEEFEVMDVRGWRKDPFSAIIKKAHDLPEGEGFKIIQYFVPRPLINMLEPMGFEVHIEKKGPLENHVYFFKKPQEKKKKKIEEGRIPLVIQSATPVVYPLIMRLLQSDRLMRKIKIEELKIWRETEKHLGWIVNKKADISFSAVAAVAKLFMKELDIKMKAIVLWDNFFMMTNNPEIRSFDDLKGKEIYLPLINTAPPYAVTLFILRQLGYDPGDFRFKFGHPFGRPDEIKDMLIKGKIEAGLLREPEASFAIFESRGKVREAFAYRDLWKKIFPEQGNLPNAGVVFKGEVLREYPSIVELFLEETLDAINWINAHREEAAAMSYELMGIPEEEVKLFLSRVHYDFKPSEEVIDEITNYINVLNREGYGGKPFGDLKDLFM